MAKTRATKTSHKAKRKGTSAKPRKPPPRRVKVPQKDKPPELWPWMYVPTEFWTQCQWRISKMWVYIKRSLLTLQRDEYEVGYYKPDGLWYDIARLPTEKQAQDLVHYLNGGNRA
jgi:hypothetical protein